MKKFSFGWSLILTFAFILIGFFSTDSPAHAATNVDTFAELKSACESGGTVNVTDTIYVTDTITIPAEKSVVLTCDHDSGSTDDDIVRHKDFHKHLFVIEDGASLTVRCCISGNSRAYGELRGYAADGKEASGYYGWALIKNLGGDLTLDSNKSVLKNNYNAITIDTDVWEYDGTKYYAFVSDNPDVTQNGLGGSAVYSLKGTFTMSNGKIYGCVGDSGTALYFASGYSADKAKITGGSIYNNIARRYGGAIFSLNRESNPITSAAASGKGYNAPRTLNSTGSNARLTIAGGTIRNNISRLGGGAIWSGHGATLYMSDGTIRNNACVESNGGAIRANAGAISSISSGTGDGALCMGLPGGQTWIAGGSIYDNETSGSGGGIHVSRIDLSEAEDYDEDIYYDNLFKFTGGSIYSNQADGTGGGIVTATETYIKGGKIYDNLALEDGGGIYGNSNAYLEMTDGSIYSNKADGDGGGIYLVSGGDECYITGGSIYENEATNGGGIASNRKNGLNVENVKIYDNIASNYGGGMYTKGTCYILSGFFYGNDPSGVHAASGTLSVQGGKFGFKTYPDGSTYTTSVNTVSQIVVGSNAECEFIGLYKPRVISGLEDDENVNDNFGLRNYGTVTIPAADGQVYFFGKGTSVYNEGTLKINGELKIFSSPKAGETTLQQRRGIHNASGGTVTVNSSDFEVRYCGERGIYNQGKFTFKNGSIHNNTAPDITSDGGGGVYNSGSSATFTMSGGSIYSNEAYRGAGIYNTNSGGTVKITAGSIYENTSAEAGGGIQNNSTLTMTGGKVYSNTCGTYGGGIYNATSGTGSVTGGSIYKNTATYGGGIGNNGDLTIGGSTDIYNHTSATNGGGVYNGGTLNMSDGTIHDNTADVSGGGIYNHTTAPELTITAADIYNNTAIGTRTIGGSGGGIYTVSVNTVTLSGENVKIHDNTAEYGGGIYCSGNMIVNNGAQVYTNSVTRTDDCDTSISEFKTGYKGGYGAGLYVSASNKEIVLDGANIYGNVSVYQGGGISCNGSTLYIKGDTIIHKNESPSGAGIFNNGIVEISENVEIFKNTANSSGGICNNATGNMTITDSVEIYSNTATATAGGLFNNGNATLNISGNVKVYDNVATSTGGGFYSTGKTTVSGNPEFYNNKASYGGGIAIGAPDYSNFTIAGGKVYDNHASLGAGIFVVANVKNTVLSGGEVYSNGSLTADAESNIKKTTQGGGVCVSSGAEVTVGESFKIYENVATYGGGMYIHGSGTVIQTGGTIYNNTGTKGAGVYLKTNGTFNMSETAIVEDDNVVYLEADVFISVPTEFTGNKDIRAHVTGADMVTGRVIAKYGDNIDAEGTKALYWDTNTVKENEQYFAVEGKLLRAGDQGAAENSDTINNQDVFISEVYSVDFDMNPTASMLFSTITHTIGENEYIFDDLMNNTINKNVYQKYWNEELSFDPGRAVCNSAVVSRWSLENDKTVQFAPDTINIIAADINENIVILAGWASVIDVDYDGNGATFGNNWTEEKVDIVEDYKVSNDDTAFTRQETTAEGTTRLFKFTGWSFDEAAIAKDYAFGATIEADELRSFVVDMEDRERAVATIYAVWDEFPTIEATDRWFTLVEAQNGEITLEELMATATATDGIVGDQTNFTKALKGSEEFTLIDFNEEDFKAFTTTGNVTVTYKAVDKVGNETYKTIIVHIVDKDEQKYDETTLFTRFISSNYFKGANGDFIEEQYGGLSENSKWRTDSDYNSLLTSTLSNAKDTATGKWTEVKETWIWSIDDIQLCKSFVATHGVGNIENPNALTEFYNQFGPDSEE